MSALSIAGCEESFQTFASRQSTRSKPARSCRPGSRQTLAPGAIRLRNPATTSRRVANPKGSPLASKIAKDVAASNKRPGHHQRHSSSTVADVRIVGRSENLTNSARRIISRSSAHCQAIRFSKPRLNAGNRWTDTCISDYKSVSFSRGLKNRVAVRDRATYGHRLPRHLFDVRVLVAE